MFKTRMIQQSTTIIILKKIVHFKHIIRIKIWALSVEDQEIEW